MQAGRKMKKIEAGLTSLDAMKAYFEGLKADLPKRKQYIQQLQASGSPVRIQLLLLLLAQ